MRILLFHILFALLSQQTTFLETENLKTSKSELETENLKTSKSEKVQKDSQVFNFSDSQIQHYENQIRLADSLYKNYLPQYNFEEVKKAVEFFDSVQLSAISRQRRELFNKKTTNENMLIAESRLLTAAKAHYYHAVGLTEKDDIVGACEHYLIALEIVEELGMMDKDKRLKAHGKKNSDYNKENYKKIRLLSLIYTRLGELFYNENCCDLAIFKYRKALKYVNLLGNNDYKSQILKFLANSYQLFNEPDSALYYYNESMRYNSSLSNKLDVEKSIAQILFYKGEKDSAYRLVKNNLGEINNDNLKYSYHYTIGDMYFSDKGYDSALYYLESSLDDDILTTRLAFCTTLSSIYDSLGNREKKAYYDNFSSKLLIENLNKEMVKSKVQILYNNYKERKLERDNAYTKKRTARMFSMVGICVIVIVTLSLIYTRYNHRKHSSRLENEIDDYRKNNDKKDEIIEMQNKELQNLIKEKECCSTLDLEAYYNSDICKSILEKKEEKYIPLSVSELSLLLDAANDNLDNIINKLKAKYPKLNTNDMYYICLIMLNVSKSGLSYLLNRSRKTIWERTKRIKTYMNLGDNEDLFLFFKNNEWCK